MIAKHLGQPLERNAIAEARLGRKIWTLRHCSVQKTLFRDVIVEDVWPTSCSVIGRHTQAVFVLPTGADHRPESLLARALVNGPHIVCVGAYACHFLILGYETVLSHLTRSCEWSILADVVRAAFDGSRSSWFGRGVSDGNRLRHLL